MDRFALFLSAPIVATDALLRMVAGRRVIAADGGIVHAIELGVIPELWIGDFDSSPATVPQAFETVPREIAPRDKDMTDGELAFEAAISRGARDILVIGALGGPRTDHAFSNLVLTLRYAAAGIEVALADGREVAFPLGAAPRMHTCAPGTQFSILRFSDVKGLTVRGAKWPLDAVDLPLHSILTQSNEATGPISANLDEGEAILLVQMGPA